MDHTRRAFLLGSVGLGALLTVTARSQSALAFTFEDMPAESVVGLAYAQRCTSGDKTGHDAILARLEAALADQSGTPGSTVSAQETCPICGCPVIATRQF
jgi:hypothetical protein